MRTLFLIAVISFSPLTAVAWQTQPADFHVLIVDGEDALNNLESHSAHRLSVRIENSNHEPAAGASVEFTAPETGPAVTLRAGSAHFAATTGPDGMATVSDLRNNGTAGAFAITVHASYQGRSIGEISIHQTNSPRKVADISNSLQTRRASGVTVPASVLGVAVGDQ